MCKNGNKLTSKQEKFCNEIVKNNLSQAEAYRKAYSPKNMQDKTIHEAASRIANDSKVAARIKQLRSKIVKEIVYSKQDHFQELEEERQFSKELKQPSSSTKATELKGKLMGFYAEKHEVTGKDGKDLIPSAIEILGVAVNGKNKTKTASNNT